MIGFEGSIKDFALTCGKGLTVFGTNATATDLPEQTQEWKYTSGYVLRRNSSGNTLTIVLYGFLTNRIATLSHSDGQWTEWDIQTRNSDLPIIESHLLNPNGNDIFTIQLDYPTTDELINVSMSGNNIDYPSIVTAYMASSNTLTVKLSKAYNRVMRVNVLYYKSK